MADFVNTIDLLGDEATFKAIVERTITEYKDNVIESIKNHAFYDCSALNDIDLPNVAIVGENAFYECSALKSIDLPNAESLGDQAFYTCSALESVSFPKVTSLGSGVFSKCTALTSGYFPNVISVSNHFASCTALTIVDFPKAKNIIGSSAFGSCENLKYVVLRNNSLCTLSNTYAFYGTPFFTNGTGGKSIVPRSLITSYRTASNWSALYAAGTCTFLALEDYTVDGTLTGAIDWDKVNALA